MPPLLHHGDSVPKHVSINLLKSLITASLVPAQCQIDGKNLLKGGHQFPQLPTGGASEELFSNLSEKSIHFY